MSQAELDALLAGQTPPAQTSAPVEDDAPMSQVELDALLAGQVAPAPASSFTEDAPLSQEDLDALVRGLETAARNEPEASSQVGGTLSQDDLDALLGSLNTNAAPPATPQSAKEEPLSQDDLDALLDNIGSIAPPSTDSEIADSGPISQDDLDALLGSLETHSAAGSVAPADNAGPLTQADLDALLAGQPPAVEGRHVIAQDELDALLDAASGKNSDPPPGSTAADRPVALTQDDLDAIIDAATGPRQAPSAGKESGDRPLGLSQDDLDALLAGTAISGDADQGVASLSDEELEGLFDSATGAPLAKAEDGPLDQANIDALLSGRGEDQVLDSSALDAPILSSDGAYDDDVSLSQSSIDSLMADLDSGSMLAGSLAATDSPVAEAAGDDDELGEISQDMIDALIANAQAQSAGSAAPASTSEIGSENFAAAATASDSGPELLSQSDLDRLIEESRQQDRARGQAKQRALEEAISAAQASARKTAAPDLLTEIQAREKPARPISPAMAFFRDNSTRIAASLLMGGLTALTSGVLLHLNRQIILEDVQPHAGAELEVALERAREEVAGGDYPAAISELEVPVARAMPGAARNDAIYVLLEAKYRASRAEYGSDEFDKLSALIEDTVAQAPSHARAPEALGWRAELFKKDAPQTALDIYKKIFDHYAEAPELDKMLLDASKLALAQNDPLTSAIYAQDLLRRFPASPWAGEAILAVGDANLIAGNEADARTTFVRIAQSEPDSGLGAQAFLRLGRLAYDTGDYDQAIMQLAKRLETTTTTEGNDEVYLLLAQSYRKAGKLNEARDTLNDLLNIFEVGPVTPRAYIEYSQVLESLGEREKAVKIAQRAAMEFPSNPEVQRNTGELLGLSGNPLAAATSLVAADDAGAADPSLLLTAARYYRTANMRDEAAKIYDRLKANYGGSQAALAGGIEAAQLRYSEGDAEGALDDLEALQAATRGTEHMLPALQAMQEIYRDLGLSDHVRSMGREIAQQATSPEVLASTAVNLLEAGDLESAQNAIDKIDFSLLQGPVAFNLLMKEGEALLAVAPQRGLEKLEEAHFNYPDARTREADQLLLQTYLATGRPAAARRLVMELKSDVEARPSDTPYLVDAAIAWGDYLYDKEDYRTAEFAYAMAEEAGLKASETVAGIRSHPDWARYQRANALLRLADYEGCVALYDKIAASDSSWAGEAAVKAGLARLEQRQRGIEMPPPPEKTARAATRAG
jgi:outer membrane protein assembly factor BamD (BamD/ComL family)